MHILKYPQEPKLKIIETKNKKGKKVLKLM